MLINADGILLEGHNPKYCLTKKKNTKNTGTNPEPSHPPAANKAQSANIMETTQAPGSSYDRTTINPQPAPQQAAPSPTQTSQTRTTNPLPLTSATTRIQTSPRKPGTKRKNPTPLLDHCDQKIADKWGGIDQIVAPKNPTFRVVQQQTPKSLGEFRKAAMTEDKGDVLDDLAVSSDEETNSDLD